MNIVLTIIDVFVYLSYINVVFWVIAFVCNGKKFKPTDKKYRYAVLICARNEEKVIAQLIDSIQKQDYPKELITTFVVAHNCTDNTAKIAKAAGAIVYEFNDNKPSHRRKGYALHHLIDKLRTDYADDFDGYFIFDADDLLRSNYVTEMNKAFDNKKYAFYTSYINNKNIKTQPVSVYSAFSLYRWVFDSARATSVLGISPHANGTGILLRSELFSEHGYNYFSMSEDIELTADLISCGKLGCYVNAAELFDEQPYSLRQLSWQRMRWIKGGYSSFFKKSWKVFIGIFYPLRYFKKKKEKRTLNNAIMARLSCLDWMRRNFPSGLFFLVTTNLIPLFIYLYILLTNGDIVPLYELLSAAAKVNIALGIEIMVRNLLVYFREIKRIIGYFNPILLVICILVSPIITFLMVYVETFALFIHVQWKPITHKQGSYIEEIVGE
ncbi:MAG: glycosyltransferase family 2 protein [Christensenellaceae bacterium]|nr:glycosyltransferase family 2 protein [Christensenellaceae bacterium]